MERWWLFASFNWCFGDQGLIHRRFIGLASGHARAPHRRSCYECSILRRSVVANPKQYDYCTWYQICMLRIEFTEKILST